MNDKQTVIKKIQETIRKKGITQRELSKRSGISEENISRIINGKNDPTLKTILKLADALEMPIQAFFDSDIAVPELIKSIINNLPDSITQEFAKWKN